MGVVSLPAPGPGRRDAPPDAAGIAVTADGIGVGHLDPFVLVVVQRMFFQLGRPAGLQSGPQFGAGGEGGLLLSRHFAARRRASSLASFGGFGLNALQQRNATAEAVRERLKEEAAHARLAAGPARRNARTVDGPDAEDGEGEEDADPWAPESGADDIEAGPLAPHAPPTA